MNNNYLLEGSDSTSINKKIKELQTKNNFEEATISNYDLNENTLTRVLEDLDTYSFLSSKKIIILSNIEIFNKNLQDTYKKDIEHLLKYLENSNPDNLFIIKSIKLNNTLKLIKDLKKKMEYIKIEYSPEDIVKESLKDYKISKMEINHLIELCDSDLTKITNECEKLKMYCIDNKTITLKDIDELVIEKLGNSDKLTWKFIEDLGLKNKKECLNDFNKLIEYNIEPISMVGLIASNLRTLLQIKLLEKDNLTKNEIAEKLGKKPFYIQKQQNLTKLYSIKDLCKQIQNLEEIDLKMKTTDLDNIMLIQNYIFNLKK